MKVVGLDLSTKSIGIGLATQKELQAYAYKPPNNTLSGIVSGLLLTIEKIVPKDKISALFIEDYAFGIFGKSASGTKLAEVGGAVKYVFEIIKVPILTVAPTTIKKFATGSGKAKKDEMRLAVYKRYGKEFETTDECDALVIADFGYHVLNQVDGLNSYQQKQVDDFRRKIEKWNEQRA